MRCASRTSREGADGLARLQGTGLQDAANESATAFHQGRKAPVQRTQSFARFANVVNLEDHFGADLQLLSGSQVLKGNPFEQQVFAKGPGSGDGDSVAAQAFAVLLGKQTNRAIRAPVKPVTMRVPLQTVSARVHAFDRVLRNAAGPDADRDDAPRSHSPARRYCGLRNR